MVAWIVVAFLAIVAFMIKRSIAEVPRGIQNVAEALVEFMLSYADGVTGDRKASLRFLPMVGSIFFFVLFANWMGLLPGFGTIGMNVTEGGHTVFAPFFRAASADLNFTIGLALVSVVASQIYGMRSVGTLAYWGKFFVPPWKSPAVIGTFVGLLEFISEFVKVISFSFRLFGNVLAGGSARQGSCGRTSLRFRSCSSRSSSAWCRPRSSPCSPSYSSPSPRCRTARATTKGTATGRRSHIRKPSAPARGCGFGRAH
jgi:F0F1-type ATP synthase membrane subunit a